MESKNVAQVGFYAGILTTVLTLLAWGIAIFTPPLTGPLCTAGAGCYSYPFPEIASRFPRDYYWMVPAMFLFLVFYILMVSIHYLAPAGKKIYSHIGLSFALVSTATLVINYFVQISVIQPSMLLGETDGIALISQFNPHGVFIALEEVGFFMMSLSMLCMAPVFAGPTKTEKAVRWLFIACFALNTLSFVLYSIFYGVLREYRFEVTTISINWLTLIVAGILLSVVFRRALQGRPSPKAGLSTQSA